MGLNEELAGTGTEPGTGAVVKSWSQAVTHTDVRNISNPNLVGRCNLQLLDQIAIYRQAVP
jgi:hypothetical protein